MPNNISVQYEDNSSLVGDELESAVKKALMLCGEEAQKYAKLVCPVDTGNLRNSISYATDDDSMIVGTNVEYASYVELGTSRQKAQPYLEPAIADHTDKYRNIIKSTLSS